MDVYAFTLAAAFVMAGLGLTARLIARVRNRRAPALDRFGVAVSLATLPLGLLSAVAHYRMGHAPGSEAPMTLPGFLAAHPAFGAVALLAAAALLMGRRA